MIPRPRSRRGRAVLLGVLLLSAGGVLAGVALLRDEPEWSTASSRAREELLAGEQDLARFYHPEAVGHFEAALAADPDFVMPKLYLLRMRELVPGGQARIAELVEDLRAADPERLTPRERLLAGYLLALIDHDPAVAQELLDTYLDEHPDDPYAVELRCGGLWGEGDWQAAEACYHALTRLDPNRVEAQNRIGYIRMARGDFAEAEAQFQIYEFLAPEQANPHDSMAELHMVTGRYDQAEEELRRALELKPDFCASWKNRLTLELLRGDFAAAGSVAEALGDSGACPEEVAEEAPCRVALWKAAADGRWTEAWAAAHRCGESPVDFPVAAIAAAGAAKEPAAARRDDPEATPGTPLEELAAWLEGLPGEGKGANGEASTAQLFLDAVRAYDGGRPAEAAALAREADRRLLYWTGQWGMKLLARKLAVEALRQAGQAEEADALEAELAAVNPDLVDHPPFPLPPPG